MGPKVDLRVAKILAASGFAPYRQIPGLDILVPFTLDGFVDPYQLNLFALSASRAAKLAERGVLVEKPGQVPAAGLELGAARLSKFPYARHLAQRWNAGASADERLWTAITLHAFAHDKSAGSAADQWAALERAYVLALELVNEVPTVPRLLTATRLAAEVGYRALAVEMIRHALKTMQSGATNLYGEPFLLPEGSFESVRPAGPVEGLVLYATLAAHERLRAFSSFFTGVEGLAELRLAALLGYSDGEMSRRLELLVQRVAFAPR